MLVGSIGSSLAFDLGLSPAYADEGPGRLTFWKMEPLVSMMQDTPPAKLQRLLVDKIKLGANLRTLLAAGALANARPFGGQDYVGYHTIMALGPAYEMAQELPEGYDPEEVGEAMSLAANQLLLRDPGRDKKRARMRNGKKPVGSVHGDSVGVHASDAINAWRNIARVSNHRNTVASLILGAYHTAGQAGRSAAKPYPRAEDLEKLRSETPAALLKKADGAIREKDQSRVTATVQRYGELGHDARPMFDLMVRYATSEFGALHAEKYYRTVTEELAKTRSAFRWRQLVGLARVTASEYGNTAAGHNEARELLGLA